MVKTGLFNVMARITQPTRMKTVPSVNATQNTIMETDSVLYTECTNVSACCWESSEETSFQKTGRKGACDGKKANDEMTKPTLRHGSAHLVNVGVANVELYLIGSADHLNTDPSAHGLAGDGFDIQVRFMLARGPRTDPLERLKLIFVAQKVRVCGVEWEPFRFGSIEDTGLADVKDVLRGIGRHLLLAEHETEHLDTIEFVDGLIVREG